MDIRMLRRAARMTQFELAAKTGISRMRLSLAECNYLSLTTEELDAIEKTTVADVQDRLKKLSRVKQGRRRTLGDFRPAVPAPVAFDNPTSLCDVQS